MSDLSIGHDFPAATEAAWRALVEKALKGGDFEKRLVTRTADGIAVRPLYTRSDALPDAPLPGAAPLTRGSTTAVGPQPWGIAQIYADEDPNRANAAILDDLAGGVSALTLQFACPGQFGLPYHETDVSAALDGVLLDGASVTLRAGEYTTDAAGSLMALWRRAGLPLAHCRGAFDYDPLATLAATGALYHPLDKSMGVAADLVEATEPYAHVTALAASGPVWHAGGASEAEEIAAVLASIVAYLRACEQAGVTPSAALPRIAVSLAVDTDQFLGIAKLRACRQLVWRIADACGAGSAAARVAVRAETSTRMMTRRDPWVNMLRSTIACTAAAMGGASEIIVLPFTHALGRPDAFARRIARNVHHVLMEESGLDRVADPAGGSWYVESLTANLARKSWDIFQAIEAKGGLGTTLVSGYWQAELERSREARAKLVATGRLEMTGASSFPRLGDDGVATEAWPKILPSANLNGVRVTPLQIERDAEPFERLRDAADAHAKRTGVAPTVFLASLGPQAVHASRSTWMANFLAAGGIDTIKTEGFTETPALGRAFAESGTVFACLCSSDAVYGELGEAAAGVLTQAGARHVLLAGRPREQDAALRAAGVGEFIFAGGDAVATLTRLHRLLGVG